MKQGWISKKFTDVVWFQEGPGVRKHQYTSDGVKLLNVANLVNGEVDLSTSDRYISADEAYGKYKHFLVDEGDLILASSGIQVDYIEKKMGFIHKKHLPLCMNTSTIRFKALNTSALNMIFFMYYLKSTDFKIQLSRLITGIAQLNFGPSHLKQMTIPVPPIEEQERIVEELDCLSGVIEKKREQLRELDALAQSIFYTMFGDPITNEKGWEVKKLGEVCEDKKKILRASKKCALDDAINYIDISAIDNINNVITMPTPYIFEEAPSRAQQVVQLGDVIVSMVRPNLKNIAIVNCDYDNLIASSGFCVLRARKEMTIPFLFYIVKSDAFTMYLMDRVSGANYPAVRESDITDYITIVPPISLQQEFADKIEAIEKQKALIKQSITQTEELFNARMDYYFN